MALPRIVGGKGGDGRLAQPWRVRGGLSPPDGIQPAVRGLGARRGSPCSDGRRPPSGDEGHAPSPNGGPQPRSRQAGPCRGSGGRPGAAPAARKPAQLGRDRATCGTGDLGFKRRPGPCRAAAVWRGACRWPHGWPPVRRFSRDRVPRRWALGPVRCRGSAMAAAPWVRLAGGPGSHQRSPCRARGSLRVIRPGLCSGPYTAAPLGTRVEAVADAATVPADVDLGPTETTGVLHNPAADWLPAGGGVGDEKPTDRGAVRGEHLADTSGTGASAGEAQAAGHAGYPPSLRGSGSVRQGSGA